MRALIIMLAGLVSFAPVIGAKDFKLSSPDGKTSVSIEVTDGITCEVFRNEASLVKLSAVDLDTDVKDSWKIRKVRTRSHKEVLYPVIWQKSSVVEDEYNALTVDFAGGRTIEWRAYDNGVAYRWTMSYTKPFKVVEECAELTFAYDAEIWYPAENNGFYSANEQKFTRMPLDELEQGRLASLPVLLSSGGSKVLVTESDLLDYAGMWMEKAEDHHAMKAVFPKFPKKLEKSGDRDEFVRDREDWIASYQDGTSFPWRIVAIADEDKDLLVNNLVYQLATPSEGDWSWVKPGKVQWDWWHDLNLSGVDFKAGLNTETYKYYIDFAASEGIDYVILDEGWSLKEDILALNPDIDVPGLISYAAEKGVDVVLWCTWLKLDERLEEAMDKFVEWGVKGIKVDFMSRDDQPMVQYYTKVSEAAAKRRLLVDFHGCYKPTGLHRTYPNVITFEGVYGMEQSKVDQDKIIGPEHNLTLPFTRMVAGPMDYTPGAMLNAHKKDWHPNYSSPHGMGTRCHSLAMYIIFESPFQMLCDSPSNYMEEPECMDFLSAVPTVWKKTVPLAAEVGRYAVVAREGEDGTWYVGAMAGPDSRSIDVDLDFLPSGRWSVQTWQDGVNAEKNAEDFAQVAFEVCNTDKLNIKMCNEGGYVAVIKALK